MVLAYASNHYVQLLTHRRTWGLMIPASLYMITNTLHAAEVYDFCAGILSLNDFDALVCE